MQKHLIKTERPTQTKKIVFTLAKLLTEKGHSQRGFARMTGIRYSTINDICRNSVSTVQGDNLALIAQILECSPFDFMEYVEMTPEEIAAHPNNIKKKEK
jgi:DNA-binding Xre family transcriptional regulator